MNDDEMLTAMRSTLTIVKDSLTDVHLDHSPATIAARARARRLRRGLSGAVAVGTALGVGLALGLSGGHAPAAARSVHVNLAAWSVDTMSSGVVDVTIRQLDDPELLGRTLAAAGVPALITSGAICFPREDGVPASVSRAAIVMNPFSPGGYAVFGIRPGAIPPGDEVDIGVQKDVQTGVGIIKHGSRLACMVVPNYAGPPPPPPPKPAPKPASAYIVYQPAG